MTSVPAAAARAAAAPSDAPRRKERLLVDAPFVLLMGNAKRIRSCKSEILSLNEIIGQSHI